MRLRLLVIALAAVLGGSACAATDDADAVQSMVLETCAPDGDPPADPVCRCAYEALVERFGAGELERLDLQLQSDPGALPEEARQLVLDCAFDRVDPTPPTTRPSPTTASTATTAGTAGADETTTTGG
ncbi:MAG: hypothetical protein H0W25_13745 [Acidimicrobiia bacterium]|nr:hypothetical protein [Acidimicrobiia bacterium]